MSDIRELYQQVIIDHGRRPRNFGKLTEATYQKVGVNPLCGDKLVLYIKVENDKITDIKFEGEGCAISMASCSLMTEKLIGTPIDEAQAIFNEFHELITHGKCQHEAKLGKLNILKGVSEFPARVKCATLAWQTINAALTGQQGEVSTE